MHWQRHSFLINIIRIDISDHVQNVIANWIIRYSILCTFIIGHFQKEDAKSAHRDKRAKNDKIEISGFIFMLTTWEYTSGHKITSPTPWVQKIWSKQLIGPFMANLLSKWLKCPKTDHLSEKTLTKCWELILSGCCCLWIIKGPLYMPKRPRNGHLSCP